MREYKVGQLGHPGQASWKIRALSFMQGQGRKRNIKSDYKVDLWNQLEINNLKEKEKEKEEELMLSE